MSTTIQSLVIPVSDLDTAKPVYTALLGDPHTDTPYYVGYNVNGLEIALNPAARANGQDIVIGYWAVKDIQASVDELVAAGATFASAPIEVGGGTTIATVTDAEGNLIGLISGPDEQ